MDRVISAQQQGAPPPSAADAQTRLKGHLGHLTKEEGVAFKQFKEICAKEGYFTPATASSPKASHDDSTLMRFLRARRFVAQDAFTQFKETEIWRKENKLEELYEQIEIKDYQESRSVYPQWTGRRDKRGIPVYLYEVRKLNAKKMLAYTSSTSKATQKGPSPSRMLRLFALYENLTRFVMPLCTAAPGRPNPESPVDQSNNIVDISGVGLKQFWNLRSHMQDASQLATAHYPETLDRIFILGAPAFFPTVWAWIKRWFDPITTSKIFVLSQQQILPTLTQFIEIDNIPEKYGGRLKFQCGDMPNLDPDLREYLTLTPGQDTERYLLTAPVRWLDSGEDGEMQALGVGALDGRSHKQVLATLQGMAMRVATHDEQLSRANTQQSTSASIAPSKSSSGAPRPLSQRRISHNTPNSPLAMSHTPAASHQPEPPSAAQSDTKVGDSAAGIMASLSMNGTAQNGAPPERITMPPPPVELGRQKTEYLTPPSEPGEQKGLA